MTGSAEPVAVEPPHLVFIHGFLDESSFWDGVVESVSTVPRTHSLAIDLPGMGSRAGDDGRFDLLGLSEAVRAAIVAHHVGEVVLVGHSMGAQIAELLACAMPGNVRGLMLVAPVPLGGLPLPDEMVAAMRTLSGNEAAQRQMRAGLLHDPSSRHLDAMVAAGLKVAPATADALLDAWRNGVSAGERPSGYLGPVCIIGGASDGFSTPELLGSQILPRFAGADLVLVEHAGHWPHVEQPAGVAAEIDRFVSNLKV